MRKQCGNNYEAWAHALSEGFLPHSYGALRTEGHLSWYDADFTPEQAHLLEVLRRNADRSDVTGLGRVIYTYEVPLAIELLIGTGRVWLLNERKYSRTSGKHRSFIRRVLSQVKPNYLTNNVLEVSVIPLDAWVAGAQLPSVEQQDVYLALLDEWHGSYDELVTAAQSLVEITPA